MGKYGYVGIETFYEDLDAFARQLSGKIGEPDNHDSALAARHVRQLCASHDLFILSLQPFSFYEGPLDREEHHRGIEELDNVWFLLAKELDVSTI